MTSAERATYLDSSALVKLAVDEPESAALRRYVNRRRVLVSSALARVEVTRALLPLGAEGSRRARAVLSRLDLLGLTRRILESAGEMSPADLRSLDAIHLATAMELDSSIGSFVTYDHRLAAAAEARGLRVARPR